MGLLNKKIKLTYQADPQLAGVMAWAGHVPVLAGPPLDARPPEFRGHIGDVKNMMDMTIGRCTVKNGDACQLVGDAMLRGLGAAGVRFAAPGDPGAALQLFPCLDVLWCGSKVELTGVVEANATVSLHLTRQGQPWFSQAYQGLGKGDSIWGMTRGCFQRAANQALAAAVYYTVSDQRLGQAICAAA